MTNDYAGELYRLFNTVPPYEKWDVRFSEGPTFENEVFSLFSYYWGDCTCGREQEEDVFLANQRHAATCPQEQFDREMAEDNQGVRYTAEEWNNLIAGWHLEKGLDPDKETECTCGVDKEYERWQEEHDHAEDCLLVKPNFLYKPRDLVAYWDRNPERELSLSEDVSIEEFRSFIDHCIEHMLKV